MKKKSVVVDLESIDHLRLRLQALAEGRPMTDVVRDLILAHLNSNNSVRTVAIRNMLDATTG